LKDKGSIESQISAAEKELADLNERKIQLEYEIKHLKSLQHSIAEQTPSFIQKTKEGISSESSEDQKIRLFRSLFRGREDVFPKRFESRRTGKSGYQPVCRNEWIRPLCQKPKIKCGECDNRDFEPVKGNGEIFNTQPPKQKDAGLNTTVPTQKNSPLSEMGSFH
jgi:hypothetical protein